MTATKDAAAIAGPVQLIDLVFPGDTNHHGTLFGGVALAHIDKGAFLAASRHGRASFVTAASEKIDFAAPARAGDMIEVTVRIVRVGTSSLKVEVELVAEAPVSGERRLCTRGGFTLVARRQSGTRLPLPPLEAALAAGQAGALRLIDMVFPGQTNLYGGDALKMMGKAAFIAATRHARSPTTRVDTIGGCPRPCGAIALPRRSRYGRSPAPASAKRASRFARRGAVIFAC